MTDSGDPSPAEITLERARDVARQLGFAVSEDVLRDVRDASAAFLDESGEYGRDGESRASTGREADDAENALLDIYEVPRQRTETGPLAGTRVAVKDNLAVRDLRMTCGAEAFETVPSFDAAVVGRLLDAGAEIVGKANMDAFAFGPSGEFTDYEPVQNPVAPERVPGGSSSGSGAAVAAGTVDVALGTDTGGSVRIPAACTGVVGVKPTHGLVPGDGLIHFAPSLDTTGPLARDVETAAAALDAIADDEAFRGRPAEPNASLSDALDAEGRNLTVGLLEPFFEKSRDRVAAGVREASQRLDGVTVTSITVPTGWIERAYMATGATEFAWYLRQSGVIHGNAPLPREELRAALADAKSDGLGTHVAQRVLPSALCDAASDGQVYAAAQREANRFREALSGAFDDVDVMLLPTIRTLPPERGRIETTEEMQWLLGNTSPVNMAGLPAVTVPVDTEAGLPISAQVIAPDYREADALSVARMLEATAEIQDRQVARD